MDPAGRGGRRLLDRRRGRRLLDAEGGRCRVGGRRGVTDGQADVGRVGHRAPVQAVARDAGVTLVTRRPLVARDDDVDPGWMGAKCLRGFGRLDDPAERIRTAARARGCGTVPPQVLERLRGLHEGGRVRLVEGSAAVGVVPVGRHVLLRLADGCALAADRVVPAAGNLAGGRRGAARITASLVGEDPLSADSGVTTGAELWPAVRRPGST